MKTIYPVLSFTILFTILNASVAQTQGIDDPPNILPVISNVYRDSENRRVSAPEINDRFIIVEDGITIDPIAFNAVTDRGADYSCPNCSENAVVLKDITFTSGSECECAGTKSITIGPGVTIKSGAKVTFRAPRVKIQSGFHAEKGAIVHIKQDDKIYYVSTQGNNQSDGLSEATAFATLGHAIKIVRPGESVYILSGTYHEALMLEHIGSSEAVITIRGLGTKPIFDGQRSAMIGFWCENCRNLLFDNLEFTNYSDIGIGVYLSTGITMQNLKVHNNGFAPQLTGWEIEGYGIDIDTSQYATIKNNQVYYNGPNPRPFGTLGTGINTFKCTDCVIQDNSSYENIGGGILVEDGVNVLVEGNEIRANYLDATDDEWWDGGLWVDGGHDIIVRNNLFANNIGPGIEISDEELQKPYGYVLENNVSIGNYYGIFIWNLSKDNTWPDESILRHSGNQFTQSTVKDVWIVESY